MDTLKRLNRPYKWQGLIAACLVLASWVCAVLYSWFVFNWMSAFSPMIILVLVFLFTGLFITAHEAMHGLVAPKSPRLNNFIGQLAMFLFAGFDFFRFLPKHHEHHDFTASLNDPDFHDGQNKSFARWYLNFMRNHFSLRPFVFYSVLFAVTWACDGPILGYLMSWPVPALLSSIQLFYFGTYLPHREPVEGYNELKSRSNDYPDWLSFLTCYHFGFHFEHHSWPGVPWWRLHRVRRELRRSRV